MQHTGQRVEQIYLHVRQPVLALLFLGLASVRRVPELGVAAVVSNGAIRESMWLSMRIARVDRDSANRSLIL